MLVLRFPETGKGYANSTLSSSFIVYNKGSKICFLDQMMIYEVYKCYIKGDIISRFGFLLRVRSGGLLVRESALLQALSVTHTQDPNHPQSVFGARVVIAHQTHFLLFLA
jgi:hypothetical protein